MSWFRVVILLWFCFVVLAFSGLSFCQLPSCLMVLLTIWCLVACLIVVPFANYFLHCCLLICIVFCRLDLNWDCDSSIDWLTDWSIRRWYMAFMPLGTACRLEVLPPKVLKPSLVQKTSFLSSKRRRFGNVLIIWRVGYVIPDSWNQYINRLNFSKV